MDSTINTHSGSSILDLSQRTTTNSVVIIDNWTNDSPCIYSDTIDNDIQKIEMQKDFNIEQSLTDQFKDFPIKEDSLSDSSNINKSKLDFYPSVNKSQ